ncbi:MAG: phosphoribosyltransferase [Haloarculaceae archaeon]
MEPTEDVPCTITDWEYVYGRSREVSTQVKRATFEPDVVVALARGGWFAGRCLCDFLGLDDLTSLKIEHYVGTAERADEPQVRYPMPEGSVADKDVLVVDDIADTGQSLERAKEYVDGRDPNAVRTATLQLLDNSEFEPDFVGERLSEWTWVVYPWNFVEDMVELVGGVMARADADVIDEDDLHDLLERHHDVGRIELEIAQPGRLPEILAEMERRDQVEHVGDGWRLIE